MAETFPLIEVSGTPRERGREYGRAAADPIRRGVALGASFTTYHLEVSATVTPAGIGYYPVHV